MNQKGRKVSPDPKEFSTLRKRGICIYILDVDFVARILNDLWGLFNKGAFIFKKKLSEEKATKIVKEVASYIYFETVKQIWEYQEGDLPEGDARHVLDVVSSSFFYWQRIENLPEKLEEYMKAKNPIEQVSRNIQKIVGHRDVKEMFMIAAIFASWTTNPEYNLFGGIREMFELSDIEMAEKIEDFFVNVSAYQKEGLNKGRKK